MGVPAIARVDGVEDCSAVINGLRWRYLHAGSGPALLLVHGFMGYSFSWRFVTQELARHFSVYAVDLPGCGVFPQSLLVANPINRYEVASHTPGLIFRSDGSLSITVSNTQPTDPTTNWLPAPTGDFFLTLRTYIPEEPILNQTWQPPALQLASD